MADKYEIGSDYCRGFSAALLPEPRDQKKSPHWLAGWDDGYSLRVIRSQKMNDYLAAIGLGPMNTVSVQVKHP